MKQKEEVVQNDYEPPIAIYDILAPVKAIVGNPSITEIPSEIANQLHLAYHLRKKCVSWYKANTSQHVIEVRQRNAKHAFPVAVLEEAISMLKARFPAGFRQSEPANRVVDSNTPSSRTSDVKNVATATPRSLKEKGKSNMFEGLSIEELEDHATVAQEVTTDTVTVAPSSQSNSALPGPEGNEADRRLDECILAKYCLYEDLQEIEDAIVLELVRYSLDQANADVLAFLVNTSIELVEDMCTTFNQSFKDCTEKGGALFRATFEPAGMSWTTLDQYGQSRMEFILTILLNGLKDTGKLPLPPGFDMQFDPGCDYFGLHPHSQLDVDISFVADLLTSRKPRYDRNIFGSFALDLVTRAIGIFQETASAGMFYFPPMDMAFAIRLRLLADIILKDVGQDSFYVMSDTLLSTIAKEETRDSYWASTAYRSKSIEKQWSTIQKIVDSRSHAAQGHDLLGSPALRQLIHSDHIFCNWNTIRTRMTFCETSLYMIDASFVMRGLAQLWNLLEEEGVLNQAWPDLQYLRKAMGDNFFFKTARPVLKERHTFKSSVLNCIGIKASNFTKGTNDDLIHRKSDPMYKVALRNTFNSGSVPLYSYLSRPKLRVSAEDLFSDDTEMIVTATVVQRLLGKKTLAVELIGDHKIENRVDLWKLQEKGPRLQPMQMLYTVKAGLEHELSLARFDFLAFEQAYTDLIDKLVDDMDTPFGGPPIGPAASHTISKVMGMVLLMMKTFDSKDPDEKFAYQWHVKCFANTFNEWLAANGSVGTPKAEKQRTASKTLLYVRPHVRKEVERIVERRGLMENVFTAEQIQGLESVKVTSTLKESIVDAWVKHKKGKKS